MIADLIRAIDAVAARCDELADRLEHQTSSSTMPSPFSAKS